MSLPNSPSVLVAGPSDPATLGPETISLPGSKSMTQRFMLVASLSSGTCRIEGALRARDTETLAEGLVKLGASVRWSKGAMEVDGIGGLPAVGKAISFDLADNGTAMRTLAAIAGLGRGRFLFSGTEALQRRPLGDVTSCLQHAGAMVRFEKRPGYVPCTVHGAGWKGVPSEFHVDVRDTTQGGSGLAIALAAAGRPARLFLAGGAGSGFLRMTLAAVHAAGREPVWREEGDDLVLELPGGEPLRLPDQRVPGDASSAGYLALAACVLRGRLRLSGLDPTDCHPDRCLLTDLVAAGLIHRWAGSDLVVEGTGRAVSDRTFEGLRHRPDAVVPLAVALAATPGRWVLEGLGALRLKESDRLEALAQNLAAAGFRATAAGDSLEIDGTDPRSLAAPSRPPVIDPRGDHRIAMAFSVLALVRPGGLEVKEPACVAKSWPGFYDALRRAVPGGRVVEEGVTGSSS